MPVKLTNAFPVNKRRFDVNGFLIAFTYTSILENQSSDAEYKYFQSSEFLKKDIDTSNISLGGYYLEDQFLKYIKEIGVVKLNNLTKFPFENYVAKAKDEITVKAVDYGRPYDSYYQSIIYTFNIEMREDGKGVKYYKKFDYKNLDQNEIAIPENVKSKIPLSVNREGYPDYYYYHLNFLPSGNDIEDSDGLNSYNKKLITLITFKIWYVVKDIFPKLVDLTKVDSVADSVNGGYGTLSNLEIIVFLLKKNWCFYYDPNSQLEHRKKPFISLFPLTIDELGAYYKALDNFYSVVYKYKTTELNTNPKVLMWLLRFLPQEVLNLLPYPPLKNIVKNFALLDKLDQELQQILVRVIIAITEQYDYANDFLVLLLNKSGKIGDDKKEMTYFQTLYYLLNDARLERLTIVKWFVKEQDNRKYFAYAIFKMWKFSKYNWDFYPSGIPHPVVDSNYVSSYWLDNEEFNKNNIIEFVRGNEVKPEDTSKYKKTGVDFESKINGVNLLLKVVKRKAIADPNGGARPRVPATYYPESRFHLFQPLTLLNYDGNVDLKLPQKILYPAFLIYFIKEYDELSDFDALISSAINLSIDIGLFYLFGGQSLINDFKYLKYTTKIGRALLGRLSATEAITVWKGAATAGQIVSLEAGQLAIINEYLIKEENDPIKRALLEKVQKVLFWAMISSAGFSIYSSFKTVSQGVEAYNIYKLSPSTYNLENDTISLLTQLYGQRGIILADFGQVLQDLKADGKISDNLIDWFHDANILTDDLRFKFIEQFGDRVEKFAQAAKGNIYSSDIVMGLNRWKFFIAEGIPEADDISIIMSKNLSAPYFKYYTPDTEPIGKVLNTFRSADRQAILSVFHDIDTETISKILEAPKNALKLMRNFAARVKVSQVNKLDKDNIITVIKTDLAPNQIDFISVRNGTILEQSIKKYLRDITNVNINKGRVKALYEGTADEFKEMVMGLNRKQINEFRSACKQVIKTKIYNDGIPVGDRVIEELFISGSRDKLNNVFGVNITPSNLIEPLQTKFDIFALKSLDIKNVNRAYDAEVKYIYNLLEKHWDKGNRFDIAVESSFYTCENCRDYWVALQELAVQSGKTINVKIIASPWGINNTTLKSFLKRP